MADGMTMKVDGLKELSERMIQLGPKLSRTALRASLNAGAQVIKKDAQTRVPILSGRLKRSVFVKRAREEATPTREVYIVGVRQGRKERQKDRDAFYWKYIEFGTKFIAAVPFLRPAFESKKMEAFEKIKSKLKERLQQLVPGA